jgi:uncharacterized membrane protein YphA (DoxX/SURF4 family)
MLWASLLSKKLSKVSLIIARLLVGFLFIYSGFVKGVDPLGTKYRIEDYLYAFNMDWAVAYSMFLSYLMNAAEFALGVLLVFNYRMRITTGLTSLMMIFFTIVTINDALHNPVPDCGCFGDALIISNWQTLYKNLVINALLFPLFFRRFSLSQIYKNKLYLSSISIIIIGFFGFQYFNVVNLPIIDFRSWKVGNKLLPDELQEVEYYVTYKHKESGEKREYLSNELPWRDSVFMANYEFHSSREVDPNMDKSRLIPMLDENMTDYSKEIISSDGYIFFMVLYDLDKDVSDKVYKKFKKIADKAEKNGYQFVILNSNNPDKINNFIDKYNFHNYAVYNSDDIDLKTIIRSSPGLIVVKDAVVQAKYHYNSIKAFDEIISAINE